MVTAQYQTSAAGALTANATDSALLAQCAGNAALCWIKLERWPEAKTLIESALQLEPENPKFLQRLATIEKELRKKQPSGGGVAVEVSDSGLILNDPKWLTNVLFLQFTELVCPAHNGKERKAIETGELLLE